MEKNWGDTPSATLSMMKCLDLVQWQLVKTAPGENDTF